MLRRKISNLSVKVLVLLPFFLLPPGVSAVDESASGNTNKPQEVKLVSSGSGFSVSKDGYLVTNNHVVQGCNLVDVRYQGRDIPTRLIYNDPINDLAILKADFTPDRVFRISRRNPSILQEIYVAGYPFGNAISSSVKATKGIVSSLSGLGNNISRIQIDAALQPGNSGGPIFDSKGNVVGVAVAKLDLLKVAKEYGTLPENTNFGIKSSVVVNLLESNGIEITESTDEAIPSSELGAIMTSATFHLSCWMTKERIQMMANSKSMFLAGSDPATQTGTGSAASVDIAGRYRSDITTGNHYLFKTGFRRFHIRMEQGQGGKINIISEKPGVGVEATREGDKIIFTTTSTTQCGCAYVDGVWEISPDGRSMKGKWKRGATSGTWDLYRQ